jgi:alkylation response protein AidB-like acyl-CoA dehydrogenase
MAFGNADQQQRFLPPIVAGTELWAQGYSEPNAGSDLANVQTRAEPDGDDWRITGQKVWTSLAHWSDWVFVLARTDRDAQPKHRGITYFLMPLRQEGVEIRPIRQVTGTSEFNEVFFDGALARGVDVVGGVNNGWRTAMGTLAFERGASTLGQQMAFRNELEDVIAAARRNGKIDDPVVRQRIAAAVSGLDIMRWNTLRVLSGPDDAARVPPAAMITKLYWATWHRDLGELAMDVLGPEALLGEQDVSPGEGYELTALQRLFLFTRSDTIYAGSNQIQRNIIGERALGLPKEPA